MASDPTASPSSLVEFRDCGNRNVAIHWPALGRASPVMIVAESNASVPIRACLAGIIVAFSLGTTTALHLVSRQYVTSMCAKPGGNSIALETLSILGRHVKHDIPVNQLQPSSTPFSTFMDRHSRKTFYVHEDLVSELISNGKLPASLNNVISQSK